MTIQFSDSSNLC